MNSYFVHVPDTQQGRLGKNATIADAKGRKKASPAKNGLREGLNPLGAMGGGNRPNPCQGTPSSGRALVSNAWFERCCLPDSPGKVISEIIPPSASYLPRSEVVKCLDKEEHLL